MPFPKCQTNPPAHKWPAMGGVMLPYMLALPAGKPRGVVLLVPGWDSVTGDYAPITRELVRHGYAVYGSENRTFAYGPPDMQGTARDWHPWVEDVKAFSRFVKARHPGVPVFWHGHSFGAVEVLQAAAEASGSAAPAGIIVHSPGFALMPERKNFLRGVLYGSVAWATFPQVSQAEKKSLLPTLDELWNCRWLHSDDRLRQGYKVRFLITSTDMGIAARPTSRTLTLPVLAMRGGKDRLAINGDESQRSEYDGYMTHELAGGRAEQFYRAEGGHMLHEGSTQRAALRAITCWLDAHSR
ncbi:MAG: alpha/beta hydrolase [Chthoniobacteraceae bacterium]